MPNGSLSIRERIMLGMTALRAATGKAPTPDAMAMLSRIMPQQGGDPPERGVAGILEAYSHMPWLRACAGKVAASLAAVEWRLYATRKGKGGARKAYRDRSLQRAGLERRKGLLTERANMDELDEITDHPFLDLLTKGNGFHTGVALRRIESMHMDLVGETFMLKGRNGVQAPTALWPIPPTWVQATPTPQQPFFRVSYRGWNEQIPASEVLWMCDPNPANPYGRGVGLGQAVSDEAEIDEYAAKTSRQLFFNRAQPDFIVYPKGERADMAPAETKRFEQNWLNRLQGYWRSWQPMFLSREVGVHEFEKNLEHLQFIELRNQERDIILQVWGIPPEQLGIVSNCHDDQTECLTRAGWKRHDALTEQDEIATWNAERETLEYQTPSSIQRSHYNGQMHQWSGARVDVCVTPEHRMWRMDKRGQWAFKTSAEHGLERGWYQWRITGGNYEGGARWVVIPPHVSKRPTRRPDDDGPIHFAPEQIAYCLGAIIAEGFAGADHRVEISQNDGPIADKMRASLVALGLGNVTERRRITVASGATHCEFRITHKGFADYIRTEIGCGARNKRLPREVFDWPVEAVDLLFEGLIDGDGSRHSNGAESYGTASEGLANDVQQLLIQRGYPATIAAGRRGKKDPLWVVSFRRTGRPIKRGDASLVTVGDYGDDATWAKPVDYDGVVWCVTVPNGIFFTRRNGKVVAHGNSNRATIDGADLVYAKQVLVPRLEFRRAIFQEMLIPEYDDRLVVDYVTPVMEDKEFALKVATAAPWAMDGNEWRAIMGLAEKDEFDGVYFVPPAVTPVSRDQLTVDTIDLPDRGGVTDIPAPEGR